MATLSNSVQDETLDHILGTEGSTSPTTVYVALYTTDPGRDDAGDEVDAAGYSRQAITFDASVDGSASNSADVEFGPAEADWGEISHAALHADESLSDLILFGALESARNVLTDDFLRFSAGNVTIELDPDA